MLLIAYTLNFIDRQIAGILAEPIKLDLGLSDSQLGWLGSAYIFVFSVATIPSFASYSGGYISVTVLVALVSVITGKG